jgi:hypothetical protein
MKKLIIWLLLFSASGSLSPLLASEQAEITMLEKRKQLSYSYTITSRDRINIDNQFGDVRVKFWNKNVVKVDITIIANSPSEEKASSFLNLVSVSNNKESGNVIFKTNINPSYSKFKLSNALSKDKSKETNLRIDYVVYMPQENELNLNNSFGDVYLPEFSSVLNLNQSYGVLYADNISNGLSKVSVNFGKANIHSMNGGDLRSNYASLNIDNASNLILNNNHGNLNIRQITDIQGILNYSEGIIGTIKEAVKLKLNYSDDLKITKIDDKVKDVEIKCNYTTIDLPFGENFNADFDIKMTNSDLKINNERTVRFVKNTEQDAKKAGKVVQRMSNNYVGKIGTKTSDARIIIVSNYGDVKIK